MSRATLFSSDGNPFPSVSFVLFFVMLVFGTLRYKYRFTQVITKKKEIKTAKKTAFVSQTKNVKVCKDVAFRSKSQIGWDQTHSSIISFDYLLRLGHICTYLLTELWMEADQQTKEFVDRYWKNLQRML